MNNRLSIAKTAMTTSVSVLVIIIITFSVSSSLAQQEKGSIVITESITTNPTPATLEDSINSNHIESMTISSSTFQDSLSFPIRYPSNILQGFKLDNIYQIVNSGSNDEGIELMYSNSSGLWLSIQQIKPQIPLKLIIPENHILEQPNINGYSGIIYSTSRDINGQGKDILVWQEDGTWFELSGNIEHQELINIARSLKPYNNVQNP